ncbi:MAG TPA: penicillin acylase family protein [Chitinophagaceae bacterium]|nr:penicillin acylase family protein [Chitinophagaceae bacterium]
MTQKNFDFFISSIRKVFLIFLLTHVVLTNGYGQSFSKEEINRWQQQAQSVTIIRDEMGIPHIYGKTDADAVFGLLYVQCEDDFKRVEMNYIEKLGRISEVNGASALYSDLLNRMVICTDDAKKDYNNAPQWMKKLCRAFADAVNFYLYKHPETRPALLTRFEPWFPFLWTDGSIGAINTAGLSESDLKNIYDSNGAKNSALRLNVSEDKITEKQLTGSNGFAFAPKITESGNSILYINPHVTFYFRPEVHVVSEEGLNVYGAVTWGQFFVYQGFNEFCGWMHTSSAVDAADSYIEKISKTNKGYVYEYEGKQRKVREEKILLRYKEGDDVKTKSFNVLYTHHGPVMAFKNSEWLSVRADNQITEGLTQSWLRNKANSFSDFKKTLDLKGNISNNTVYADAAGNIAYWHGNRIPIRDTNYNWNKPVDGTIAATEWKGYYSIDKIIQSINPENGWLQNCNSTPFTVAGKNSPDKKKYPVYMAPDGENFRGINAVRTLGETKKYNLDKVIKAGYDTRLAAFEVLVPSLVKAFETSVKYPDTLYALLVGPVTVLKHWDERSSENSIATTLAVEWGERLLQKIIAVKTQDEDQVSKTKWFAANAKPEELLMPLLETINDLKKRFGRWQMGWGQINRFQRISSDIENKFDDNQPSFPVGFVSSMWGMLPSYNSKIFAGTQKRYGIHGNSFICAVEFGKKLKAKALLAGGESGNVNSPHFFNQGKAYSKGIFRDVWFYKEDVVKHIERTYRPGE